MAKSDQEIRNLIAQLNQLSKTIETVRVNLDNLNDIKMSDSLNNQIYTQIELLKLLQVEYRNVGRAIQETSRFQLPAGNTILGQSPRQPVPYSNIPTGNTIYGNAPQQLLLGAGQQQLALPAQSQLTSNEAFLRSARPAFEKLYEDVAKNVEEDRVKSQQSSRAAERAIIDFWASVAQEIESLSKITKGPINDRIRAQATSISQGGGIWTPDNLPTAQRQRGGGGTSINDFIEAGSQIATGLEGGPKYTYQELAKLNSEYGKAIKLAEDYGYGLNSIDGAYSNLVSVQKESTTGISRLRFQMEKMPGIFENLNVTVDRFGNVLQDSQKRFRSFGSTVARNIAEVAKWTIAVQVIYAPMRKFQELIDVMIANESKLADITVAVGKAQSDTNKIFQSAADVADATGESINGVLEGYELAYRAAGSISDSAERAATANVLLADSMILSKLSSLDQAQALDTLVGALNQLGYGLTDGRALLDKWVKVSNNANVSLSTLAESFAITASSASNAGLSVDELNGIIATVAENTTLSATEAGNAVRAFISGFQTDKAQKELGAFGISLKTVSGDVEGFYDVMLEINNLWQSGLISDSELNRIGEAIGGGARRGAQVVTTIQNLSRVQEVAAVSADAHGDAEEALGIKLDTVQTKVTQLGNSFQSLAQTLGTEGGILDTFKVFADVANFGLKAVDGLAKVMGNSLPIMLAFALALKQINEASAFSERFQNAQLGIAQRFPAGRVQDFLSSTKGTYSLLGGIGVGAQAGVNLAQGNQKGALGNIVGGLAGGFLGALTGSPQLIAIGAQVGSAAAGSFANNILDYEGTFSNFFEGVTSVDTKDVAEKSTKSVTELLKEEQQKFTDELTNGSAAKSIAAAITQGIFNGYVGLANLVGQDLSSITREQAGLINAVGLGSYKNLGVVNQLNVLRAGDQSLPGTGDQSSYIENKRNELAKEYADILADITDKTRQQAQEQVATGDITAKQFNTLKDSLSGFDIQLASFGLAFGEIAKGIDKDFSDSAEVFQFFADVIANGSAEDIEYLTGLRTELFNLLDLLNELGTSSEIQIGDTIISRSDIESDIASIQDLAYEYLKLLDTQQRFETLSSPSIVNVDATKRDFDKILDYADEWMNTLYQDLVENTGLQLTLEEWRGTFEGFFVDLGPEMGRIWIEGFSQQAITGAQKTLEEMGEIFSESNIGLKSFQDLSMSELQGLAAQSLAINESLKQKYGKFGYKGETETFIGVAKDGIAGPITAELTILQMLMRDLIDVNEEQLQGIYNLPADASFYVPFTGYALGQGGGGGGGNIFDNLIDTGQTVPAPTYSKGGITPGFDAQDKDKTYTPSPMELFYAQKAQGLLPEQKPIKVELPQDKPEEPVASVRTIKDFESGFRTDLDTFINDLRSDFVQIIDLLNLNKTKTSNDPADLKSLTKDIEGLKPDAVQTNLNININSNTLLQLDGQVVANVVKQYLHDEILRQESTSTITRGVVI